MYSVRTDMAIEAAAIYNKPKEETDKLKGVSIEKEEREFLKITRVKVTDKDGEKSIGKPMGNYITIDALDPNAQSQEFKACLIDIKKA